MAKSKRASKSKGKRTGEAKAAKPRKQSYVKKPLVPDQARARYEMAVRIMSEEVTISAGAAQLGLSREQMQTIVHRAQEAMLKAVMPQPRGRPRKDPELVTLEKENATLKRKMRSLGVKAEAMEGARDLLLEELQDRLEQANQTKRERAVKRAQAALSPPGTKTKTGSNDDSGPIRKLRCATGLRRIGAKWSVVTQAVRTSYKTLRRWAARASSRRHLRDRRGPGPKAPPDEVLVAEATQRVRATKGQIGAAALAKALPGLSRRQAAVIKLATKRELERVRRQSAHRVHVHARGVIRAFDALALKVDGALQYGLAACDRATAFLTSLRYAASYDTEAVADVLETDFHRFGAPLVLLMDNASCHKTALIEDLLEDWGVLALYSPPRYPQFNGGCERKVRDCRSILDDIEFPNARSVREALATTRENLNELRPGRSLGWCTPKQAWQATSAPFVDREALRASVTRQSISLLTSAKLANTRLSVATARRIAIKQTLQSEGLITIVTGGWC